MILGIDASTPGSGGGKRHLIEIIKRFNPDESKFSKIRIWGVSSLLNQLPDKNYVEKITHSFLNKGFFYRTIWQLFIRDKEFINKFDILLSPFGTYSSSKITYVSMSRNMLVFDRNERKRFGFSFLRLKLKLLQIQQIKSFKKAAGVIFLSKHAENLVRNKVSLLKKNIKIIHHGIGNDFIEKPKEQSMISTYNFENPYQLLYVSAVWAYKHHWNVVEAVAKIRKIGYPITLTIVGNNDQSSSGEILKKAILKYDSSNDFIFWKQGVSLNKIAEYYKSADAFIFASTCENMPNILIEAMSSGLPILCSSFQPMPEFLKNGGLYFDPTNTNDLTQKLRHFIDNPELRMELATTSSTYAKNYSWDKCAGETFDFLYDNVKLK
jgi:glycosyltransferase involved in cell wall biosynthesis